MLSHGTVITGSPRAKEPTQLPSHRTVEHGGVWVHLYLVQWDIPSHGMALTGSQEEKEEVV